jgi:transposase
MLRQQLNEQKKANYELHLTIDNMQQTIDGLQQMIETLNQTVKELTEKLSMNSRNSSKPPSSDGLGKPSPKSLRQPSGKKPGGQEGHPGSFLGSVAKPDEIVRHMPSSCSGCPLSETCEKRACVGETRQVVDAVVTVKVTEHQSLVIEECPLHGVQQQGEFPDDIKANVQYGEQLQALTVALNTIGAVSVNRTHEILSGVFGVPISTGTVVNMVSNCAEGLTEILEIICRRTVSSMVVHFDETGTRVNGKNMWVHVASDKLIELAYEENPLPEVNEKKRGRKKKGKVLALIERLDIYEASVCLFVNNFAVPFDNNQAERDCRNIKTKTKVSGCFRSLVGAENYLKIMSYVGTAKKRGLSGFEAIKLAIMGTPEAILSM